MLVLVQRVDGDDFFEECFVYATYFLLVDFEYIAKLAAILKVANAMDRSHKQKFKNVKTSVSGRNLIITIETEDDVTLEKGLFESKASFFEEVFSMKPVIKVKKVYS